MEKVRDVTTLALFALTFCYKLVLALQHDGCYSYNTAITQCNSKVSKMQNANMQQIRAAALQNIAEAEVLLQCLQEKLALAVQALEEHGAYTQHDVNYDVCSVVRDVLHSLQRDCDEYIN